MIVYSLQVREWEFVDDMKAEEVYEAARAHKLYATKELAKAQAQAEHEETLEMLGFDEPDELVWTEKADGTSVACCQKTNVDFLVYGLDLPS